MKAMIFYAADAAMPPAFGFSIEGLILMFAFLAFVVAPPIVVLIVLLSMKNRKKAAQAQAYQPAGGQPFRPLPGQPYQAPPQPYQQPPQAQAPAQPVQLRQDNADINRTDQQP